MKLSQTLYGRLPRLFLLDDGRAFSLPLLLVALSETIQLNNNPKCVVVQSVATRVDLWTSAREVYLLE